jgi:hypothetical protein
MNYGRQRFNEWFEGAKFCLVFDESKFADQTFIKACVSFWWSLLQSVNTGGGCEMDHKNIGNYVTGVKDPLIRKKIAILIHQSNLKSQDVEDDFSFFHNCVNGGKWVDQRTLEEFCFALRDKKL